MTDSDMLRRCVAAILKELKGIEARLRATAARLKAGDAQLRQMESYLKARVHSKQHGRIRKTKTHSDKDKAGQRP